MTDFAVVVSPLMRCPDCGCTASVQVPCDEPEPGDLVICIGCEAICIRTSGLALRLFVDDDLAYYTLDDVARAARAVHTLRASFERKN